MSRRGKVSQNRARAPERSLARSLPIQIEHESVPDAQARLRRAYDLVLRAAARAEAVKEAPKGLAQQEIEEGS